MWLTVGKSLTCEVYVPAWAGTHSPVCLDHLLVWTKHRNYHTLYLAVLFTPEITGQKGAIQANHVATAHLPDRTCSTAKSPTRKVMVLALI